MSTTAWPPLPAHELKRAEEATLVRSSLRRPPRQILIDRFQARELRWLLSSLQDTFASLRAGLDECHALLSPAAPGATLVVSSPRSEAVKGVVVRVGARIVKADVQLRLATLPPPPRAAAFPVRLAASSSSDSAASTAVADAPVFAIPQLAAVRNCVAQALDVVDAATYTGDAQSAPFVAGQLRLLLDLMREARAILKGEMGGEDLKGGGGAVGPGGDGDGSGPWWENPMDENVSFPLARAPYGGGSWRKADARARLSTRPSPRPSRCTSRSPTPRSSSPSARCTSSPITPPRRSPTTRHRPRIPPVPSPRATPSPATPWSRCASASASRRACPSTTRAAATSPSAGRRCGCARRCASRRRTRGS